MQFRACSFVVSAAFFVGIISSHATSPTIEDIKHIRISSLSTWTLDINEDGSGTLSFGASISDRGVLPKNTVSTADIYNHFSNATKDGNIHNASLLTYLDAKGTSTSFYSKDAIFVSRLMKVAFAKAVFLDKKRAADIVQRVPFVLRTNEGKGNSAVTPPE